MAQPSVGEDACGVLPCQYLERAVAAGVVVQDRSSPARIQPASIDLQLGEVAYRLRCSFLPGAQTVEEKLKGYVIDELDLRGDGAVLETSRPYLIPLAERLDLPPALRARTNPKSTTGRLDVFTRVITDCSHRFDDIAAGYAGQLWLEVVPLSFLVRVRQHVALNQLRLIAGTPRLDDDELRAAHEADPILYTREGPAAGGALDIDDGLFLGLDLRREEGKPVGWRAKHHAPVIDYAQAGPWPVADYWEPVVSEVGDRVVLAPERFYLLMSAEAVRIPPGLAAEMTAYDPTSGELRTHYAGFFDPGFGYDPRGAPLGSQAALEVRAHDVPFMIEHGQRVCRLRFERMLEPPERLYGAGIGSSYQAQHGALGRHFR
ncbi:MAG: 2'-deoxycytidine 5'-triphosphate deaminase [Acidimicrobiales bacterium]